MRKIYILIIVVLFCHRANAQHQGKGSSHGSRGYNIWTELGVKDVFSVNFLMNTNVIDDVNIKSPLSFGNSIGLKFGVNFNQTHGFTIDGLYNGINQRYKSENDSMNWSKEVHLKYFDIPVLYRNFSELTYFEIGPQFSFLADARESFTANLPSPPDSSNSFTDKGRFNPYNIGAVIGFGTAMWSTDNVAIFLAFRIQYSFLDVITSKGRDGKDYPYYLFPGYNIQPDLSGYKSTNCLSGGFTIEINYNIQSCH